MLDKFRSLAVGLSLIVLIGLVGLYFIVQVGGGEDIFGDKDGTLPPVDFAALSYTPDDAGYLLCPVDLCVEAIPDGVSPVFEVNAAELRQLFVAVSDSNPTIRTFRFNLPSNQFDFTERMPGKAFPAVVTIKIIPLDAYSSTAAIYSWQPVGDNDEQGHMDRVGRWLRLVTNTTNR
jgi:hypothetical protein